MTLNNNQKYGTVKKSPLSLGIDIGSTTAKLIITQQGKVIYEKIRTPFFKGSPQAA